MIADLQSVKEELTKAVVAAVRRELRRDASPLKSVSYIARFFRLRDQVVRQAASDGLVRCARRQARNGKDAYLIDFNDAARIWGAS